MTEAVVEKVEVEAEAEEVFKFFSDVKNVCVLLQTAEESRRVDLSESFWNLRGPAGRSVEFGPDAFRGCLRRKRLGGEMAGPSSPDIVLGDVFIDFKALSARKTLLFLTYHSAAPFAWPSGEPAGDAETWGRMRRDVNLHLRALIEDLLAASWHERGASLHDDLTRASAAGDTPVGSEGFVEDAMTDEDRAWMETDLSRLHEYDPYELTEEQLAEEETIRYVPGLGLIVEDDDGSDAPPWRETDPGSAG